MTIKRIFATMLSVTLLAGLCTGCASGTTDSAKNDAPVNDGPIDLADLPTENMVKRSRLYDGDSARFASKLDAALKGEKVNIVFLGDSITQGSSASWENQYTMQVEKWWKENIGGNAEFVNAGIGATDSYLGVHRCAADVLSKEPDIVFIEFINDGNNDFYKTAMESLVRKCLGGAKDPAVVLIEMTQENGTCPQEVHTEIAKYYKVPVISYHDAVLPEVDAGNLSWQDISPDNIHPNDAGHIMLAKLITSYIDDLKKNIDSTKKDFKPFDNKSKSLTGDKYADALLLGKEEVSPESVTGFDGASRNDRFKDGWAAEDGGTITFELEFKTLGMLFNKMTEGGGTAFIKIDGIEIAEINADFSGGWGSHASNQEIISFEEKGKHTVTVTVGKGRRFEILRWMVS